MHLSPHKFQTALAATRRTGSRLWVFGSHLARRSLLDLLADSTTNGMCGQLDVKITHGFTDRAFDGL